MGKEGFRVRAGEVVGALVVRPVLESRRLKVHGFKVDVQGADRLKALGDRPYILVANHLQPEGKVAEQFQLSPDAFVLERVVRRATRRGIDIVAKFGDGWWDKDPQKRARQERLLPFLRGLMKGAGFIPVNKNPGALNRELLGDVSAAFAKHEPIMIFPEGNWYSEEASLSPTNELSTGAANIALRNPGIPIVPVFIAGAHRWKWRQKVAVVVGQPFLPREGENKMELTARIGDELRQLQSQYRAQQQGIR